MEVENLKVKPICVNGFMVVLTVEAARAKQAMESTVLVHPKRPEAWHAKNDQMMLMEMEKTKHKGTFLNLEINRLKI